MYLHGTGRHFPVLHYYSSRYFSGIQHLIEFRLCTGILHAAQYSRKPENQEHNKQKGNDEIHSSAVFVHCILLRLKACINQILPLRCTEGCGNAGRNPDHSLPQIRPESGIRYNLPLHRSHGDPAYPEACRVP